MVLIGMKIFKRMNMFYKIWADCLYRIMINARSRKKALINSVVIMSFFMSINFLTIMLIAQRKLGEFFYEINIRHFSGFINYILTLFILYYLPMVVVNTFFVVRNIKKVNLLITQGELNGKFILTYMLISVFIPIILFWTFWLI